MLGTSEGQSDTNITLMFQFIKRILEINRNGKDMCEGVTTMNLIIALLENMQGHLDFALP
jgi:hypothetical protein